MTQENDYPSYLPLAVSGELDQRAAKLRQMTKACCLCPRACGVDRTAGKMGYCRAGERAVVASHNAHHGEEPPISGSRGSGTIFFAHCTMRCIFCQNFPISQLGNGREVSDEELAGYLLDLQKRGCHNINLVTGTHYLHVFVAALGVAVSQGFRLPIVYNTSGFDSVEVLRLLDGIVDIYLPDMKYSDAEKASRYSDSPRYIEHDIPAVKEMYRQVGELVCDEDGIARRGLIVRHLVLPEAEEDSIAILSRLKDEISPTAFVSLMSQYFPAHRAHQTPPLDRRVNWEAYERVVEWMATTDLQGWIQPLEEE